MDHDLFLVLAEPECPVHEWLATMDQYGNEGAECERCGALMGTP